MQTIFDTYAVTLLSNSNIESEEAHVRQIFVCILQGYMRLRQDTLNHMVHCRNTFKSACWIAIESIDKHRSHLECKESLASE